jgi:hypothetical protein
MTKYRFNKEKHLHEILVGEKWQSLTGCTTILSVLAKPALIQWAANMAVGYVREQIENISTDIGHKQLYEILEEARKAHTKKKEKAGDYGTQTHEAISKLIGLSIKKHKGFIPEPIIDFSSLGFGMDKSVKNFIDWAVKNKVKFLQTEKNIYSEKLFIGGIIDFVCEIDGKIWLGDIKTSGSGIYPEHFAQVAGYQLMLQEMGLYPDVTGYIVLNLKESGEMLEKRSISNSNNTKFFLACLEIYRHQERLKSQTI